MKIYVANLSKTTSEDKILKAFKKFGDVISCNLITDKISDNSKGYGFVEMSDADAGEKAIDKLNGSDLDGKSITVSEAREKGGISSHEKGGKFGDFRSKSGNKSQVSRNTSRGGNRGD